MNTETDLVSRLNIMKAAMSHRSTVPPASSSESALPAATFNASAVALDALHLGSSKLALQSKIKENLHEVFQVPQLIDGLTDYLAEILANDPKHAVG